MGDGVSGAECWLWVQLLVLGMRIIQPTVPTRNTPSKRLYRDHGKENGNYYDDGLDMDY